MAEINIYGTLNNATPDGVIAKAEQIKDSTEGKKQSEINADYKKRIETLEADGGAGSGGTTDYTDLTNKPQINGHELSGNKSASDLGLQQAGDYATKNELNGVKPTIGENGNWFLGEEDTDVPATGPKGEKGDKGEQGNSGVSGTTDNIVVVNNLNGGESTPGNIKVLAAEQGKVLNDKLSELQDDTISKSIFNDELFSYPEDSMTLEALEAVSEIEGYFSKEGVVNIQSGFGKIKIYKYDGIFKLSYRTAGIEGSIGISDVDDGSKKISVLKTADGNAKLKEYFISTDKYVYVYVGSSEDYECFSVKFKEKTLASTYDIDTVYSEVERKADRAFGENLFNKDSEQNSYDSLLSEKNVISTPSYAKNFMVTHYIRIKGNTSYIANYTSTDNSINLCVVDEDYSVLLYINKSTDSAEYKFTAPEGAAFVRMTLPMSKKDTFVFNEGESVKEGAVFEYKFLTDNGEFMRNPWKGMTIGLYGDSITELCGNDSVTADSWAAYLRDYLSANIIVRGWGGTPIKHMPWDNSTDGQNKWWFNENGEKVKVDTPDGIEINVGGMCDWKRIITQFPPTIKDTIDAVILMGGTNDFSNTNAGDVLFVEEDSIDADWHSSEYYNGGDFNVSTIKGAVCSAIMKLQAWMPQAVIIIATPLSGRNTGGGFNGTNQQVNSEGLNEMQFANAIKEAAAYMSVPVIDINTLTGINQLNRKYYIKDGVHPYKITDGSGVWHNNGSVAMARVFMKGMDNIYPKFDYIEWKEDKGVG